MSLRDTFDGITSGVEQGGGVKEPNTHIGGVGVSKPNIP